MTPSARFRGSSRQHPCPVCSRTTDDKCRASDELILCYVGDMFAPPPGLKPGDTITIDGKLWAVVALDAGFAGNSVAFRPDKPRPGAPPCNPRRVRHRAAVTLTTLHRHWLALRSRVHLSFAILDPECLTLDELRRDAAIVAATLASADELLVRMRAARRDVPRVSQLIAPVMVWRRQLHYLHAAITAWDQHYLGTK